MKLKAIFLDRDGVVNQRIVGDYIKYVDEFIFKDDFLDIYDYISDKDLITLLATNQQGIGKGLMNEEMLSKVHDHMQTELQKRFNKNFDKIYFCPDLAKFNSYCRKPNPGMIIQGLEEFNIQPSEAIMVGDSISDVIAGKSAGLTTYLIGDYKKEKIPEADFIFKDLYELKQFLTKKYF